LFTVVVIVLIELSATSLGHAIGAGLRDIYQSLAGSGDGRERLSVYFVYLFEGAVELLGRYLPISVPDLRNAIINQTEKWVTVLLNMTTGAIGSITTLGLPTTHKVARPVNTSAFLGSYLLRLPTSGLLDYVANLQPRALRGLQAE
jgi:hypothetical protein